MPILFLFLIFRQQKNTVEMQFYLKDFFIIRISFFYLSISLRGPMISALYIQAKIFKSAKPLQFKNPMQFAWHVALNPIRRNIAGILCSATGARGRAHEPDIPTGILSRCDRLSRLGILGS